jgi:hypothetical protein
MTLCSAYPHPPPTHRAEERAAFLTLYQRYAAEERQTRSLLPGIELQHREQAAIDRVPIARTFIDQGFFWSGGGDFSADLETFRGKDFMRNTAERGFESRRLRQLGNEDETG